MFENASFELFLAGLAAFILSILMSLFLRFVGGRLREYSPAIKNIIVQFLMTLFILIYALTLWLSIKYFCGYLGFSRGVVMFSVGLPLLLPPIFYGLMAQTKTDKMMKAKNRR